MDRAVSRLDHKTVSRLLAEGAACPLLPVRTRAVLCNPYRHQSWLLTVQVITAAWDEPPDLTLLDDQPPDCDPNELFATLGDWVDCANEA